MFKLSKNKGSSMSGGHMGQSGRRMGSGHPMRMMRFHSAGIREITPPRYDASVENEKQEDDVTLVVAKVTG